MFLFIAAMFFTTFTARAVTVSLDAVDNAGWYAEDLSQSYLTLMDGNNNVAWSYNGSNLLWTDFSGMVADLSDGYIGSSSGGSYLGPYTILSGGDVFGSSPTSPIWTSLSLSAGRYEISLDPSSRAYNLLGYIDPNYSGGNLWNAYVQMWTSDGQDLAFGSGSTIFGSEADTLSYYFNPSNNISLNLAGNADLYFYINDYNSLDNIGNVTLNISSVPLPSSLLLLCTGIVALYTGRGRIIGTRKA